MLGMRFAELGRLLSEGFTKVLTIKGFLGGTFIALLIVALYDLVVRIIEEVGEWAIDRISQATEGISGVPSGLDFVGVAGYMAGQLRLVDCMAWVVTMVMLKFTLRKIPFLRW